MLKHFLIIVILAVAITSCTTTKYFYNNILYDTPETALKVAREDQNQNIQRITQTETPLGGRALCAIPSRNLIEKKGIRKIAGVNYKPEVINYNVTMYELFLESQAEALQRRRIFDEVKIVKSENPDSVTIAGYDVFIYLVINGPDQTQWFLMTSRNKTTLPIYSDMSLPTGVPRLMSWLKNIEQLSKEQLGK